MKFATKILAVLAGLAIANVSQAQVQDVFSATRTYVLAAPQNFTAASGIVTNGPVDHVKLLGRVKVDFMTVTNTGTTGGTLTAQIYTSSDTTNLTALSNYALISSTTADSITNWWSYGGSNVVANAVLLPGTLTTPVAASGGFVTPYLAPLPFTNSGAITLNGNKTVEIGFNIIDQPRYIYVVYTTGGTVTNFTGGAILTGTPSF
ncbi:MAG: hypothetical protein KGJ13_05830 [Patescibacteria group bacterium]|nr:hypothetical protein [Patescibacteria group bacterium]